MNGELGAWAERRETLELLRVGSIAHGGHCVAHLDGRVVFVRHALPGELVRVRVTDRSQDRFWRADAVEIVEAAPGRVGAPCPVSGPGGCGGCDFQHVSVAAQRELKRIVVADQLHRLADLEWTGEVEAVPEPRAGGTELAEPAAGAGGDGQGWRTRMRYRVDDDGRAALRAHRSHELVPLPAGGCRIAHPALPDVVGRSWPAGAELIAACSDDQATLLVDGRIERGTRLITERPGGRALQVAADGFWQVHPGAARVLVAAVLDGLRPSPEQRALDLYCGVGLFAAALADHGCSVVGVEASRPAIEQARRNLADLRDRARFLVGRVERTVARWPERVDLIVLDPPRAGAGRAVIRAVVGRQPEAIAYVACDPAALARDLAYAAAEHYRVTSVRAFDLFPMTHHVECVAILRPVS